MDCTSLRERVQSHITPSHETRQAFQVACADRKDQCRARHAARDALMPDNLPILDVEEAHGFNAGVAENLNERGEIRCRGDGIAAQIDAALDG